ncbi:MAG: type I restriction enzyme HsdR N-terminal domain-containing protein [Alloprevotella sp.]|nr:type I restriction enzyme HsdR N-terminal domain-containing protein [Alloprevotella sp.]
MPFPALNLPAAELRIRRTEADAYEVFDFLRRRYVKLTPEEWVRQHFTHFLVEERGFPAGLLGNEVCVEVNGARRRCDSLLFDRQGLRPRLIAEYKAPTVVLTQDVFTQIQSYNSVLRADYLVVSNGLTHYVCRMDYATARPEFLADIPHYEAL